MSSKRRTFHVDWDSPSNETGTVKRRPASLSVSFSNDRFENIEYYELRDCAGGYSLNRLESTGLGFDDPIVVDVPVTKDEKIAAIKDNGNRSGQLRSNRPCEEGGTSAGKDNDLEKSKTSGRAKGTFASYSIEQKSPRGRSEVEEWETGFFRYSAKSYKFRKKQIDELDKKPEDVGRVDSQNLSCKQMETWKDLELSCRSFEWKSAVHRGTRINKSKSRSLIPRPKVRRPPRTFSLVSSSSESSGFGSPLSPLSPQQDPLISKDTSKGVLRASDSKSSGLGSPGSPDSPLSPESQTYSAFHLIQLQLEKLRNCSCEERQAEVIRMILEPFQ